MNNDDADQRHESIPRNGFCLSINTAIYEIKK